MHRTALLLIAAVMSLGAAEIVNGTFARNAENWSAEGATATRDTEVFHSKPAALRCEGIGSVFQDVAVKAGGTLAVQCMFKVKAPGNAQVFVQFHTADWKTEQFTQVHYAQGDSDWARVKQEVAVPAWAERARIGVLLADGATAWLDDVE